MAITLGAMDPTPHARMPKRACNLEETNFTNVGFDVSLICNAYFLTDPIHVWHRPLLQQLPFFRYIEI